MEARCVFQKLSLLLPAIAMAFLSASCGPATAPQVTAAPTSQETPSVQESPTPSVERPLVVGIDFDPETLDGHKGPTVTALFVINEVCERLIEMKPGSSELVPRLAESWEVSDDGLQYTFHLRKDVIFHDGTPFNAEAVKWNTDRQGNHESPYYQMESFWAYDAFVGWAVDSVEVVDEHTVQFNLNTPYPYFLPYMATDVGFMVSPAGVEEYQQGFGEHPVCTGPFEFVSWEKGQEIVLERNDDYWGPPAGVAQLIFKIIPDESTKVAALQTGDIQLAQVTPAGAQQLARSPELQLAQKPSGSVAFLGMNVQWGPLADINVRRAVAHAINKESIVQDILWGMVDIAQGPISPVCPDYTSDVATYDYDPQAASTLLAEAGYADGFDVTLTTTPSRTGLPQNPEVVAAIQADLAAVGIRVKVESLEPTTQLERIRTPDVQMFTMQWTVAPIIAEDQLLGYLFDKSGFPPEGYNACWYSSEQARSLLDEAATTVDDQQRGDLIKQVQKTITEDAPAVFLYHVKAVYGLDARLDGFDPGLDMSLHLNTVSWVG